tara:strand:- start:556 stop:867 length:312 start_codon:yes stop_codon:yes gene_type:complete
LAASSNDTYEQEGSMDHRRRLVAMLSVMKGQVNALRSDIETARRELAVDPENDYKRSMVRQYTKRNEEECLKVRRLGKYLYKKNQQKQKNKKQKTKKKHLQYK